MHKNVQISNNALSSCSKRGQQSPLCLQCSRPLFFLSHLVSHDEDIGRSLACLTNVSVCPRRSERKLGGAKKGGVSVRNRTYCAYMTSIRYAFQFARHNEFRRYKFYLLRFTFLRELGEQTRERSYLYILRTDIEHRTV